MLEPKRKRKAKARQKSPKITHAVAPEMSLPRKRGRKPGKGTGAKHESRKFDAQMRPRIKGRFVSRKVYRDLYGSDGEGGEGGEGEDGAESKDGGSMEGSTSSTSLSTQGTENTTSSVSTDAEDASASSSVADGEGGKEYDESNSSVRTESEDSTEDSTGEGAMKVGSRNTGITETAM